MLFIQVSWSWIKSLVSIQKKNEIKMAFKLKDSHVNPSHYEKMRVALAAQVFSNSTASSLEVS